MEILLLLSALICGLTGTGRAADAPRLGIVHQAQPAAPAVAPDRPAVRALALVLARVVPPRPQANEPMTSVVVPQQPIPLRIGMWILRERRRE